MSDLTIIRPEYGILYSMGRKQTEETKEKLRRAHLGKKLSEEHKRSISAGLRLIGAGKWNLGRKASAETKKKLSDAHKGIPKTEEWRKKIGLANKGKTVDTSHLEAYWFKKGIAPYNKGVPNYDGRGEKASNWKGGITPANALARTSLEYRQWRTAVFERDNYTCVECGARSGNGKKIILNADHIKRFADYPELRFELSNGQTLCVPCHKIKTWG